MEKNEIYRRLPRVDSLMKEKETEELVKEYGYDCVLDAVRGLWTRRGKNSDTARLMQRKNWRRRWEGVCPESEIRSGRSCAVRIE